nr:MAG TPA: hypothetical protein [Caudoviricetes sp.]
MGFTRYNLVSYQRVVTWYCRDVRGYGGKNHGANICSARPGAHPISPPDKVLSPLKPSLDTI